MESTTNGTPVLQFSVMLENRVGALLGLVKLLNDHAVDVIGLSVQDSYDTTVVRLVVTDSDTVQTVFIEKGIAFGTSELLVVALQEGPAQLGECHAALLQAETNIYFCYPLLVHPSDKTMLALRLDDHEFGGEVLHNNGFKVLCQEDLSR